MPKRVTWPEGCNGGAQRAPLPRCVVLQHTSCVALRSPVFQAPTPDDPINEPLRRLAFPLDLRYCCFAVEIGSAAARFVLVLG